MKTKYKVRYSPVAVDDLKEIYSYIANELKVQETAQQQTERIRRRIRSLDQFPGRHKKVDWEPWSSMNMYKVPVDHFSVYYQIKEPENIVLIVRIFYNGRDVESIINPIPEI